MTETTALPPLEIVDGERFTIRHFAGSETLEVAKDVDGDLAFHAEHDGTVAMIAAADVPRFIEALARLTGNEPTLLQVADFIKRARREALEEAAKECDEYAAWHQSEDDGLSGFDRMATGARECAAVIRALAEPAPASHPPAPAPLYGEGASGPEPAGR